MAVAEGASVRLKAHHVELRAQPALLFDHLSGLLQEQLVTHPWYAEPLRIAAERARKYLSSEVLHVQSALRLELSVEGGECHLIVEGVPGAMEPPAVDEEHDAAAHATSHSATATDATVCATFTNDINLLDLVADVQDIYRSFIHNTTRGNLDKFARTAASKS